MEFCKTWIYLPALISVLQPHGLISYRSMLMLQVVRRFPLRIPVQAKYFLINADCSFMTRNAHWLQNASTLSPRTQPARWPVRFKLYPTQRETTLSNGRLDLSYLVSLLSAAPAARSILTKPYKNLVHQSLRKIIESGLVSCLFWSLAPGRSALCSLTLINQERGS